MAAVSSGLDPLGQGQHEPPTAHDDGLVTARTGSRAIEGSTATVRLHARASGARAAGGWRRPRPPLHGGAGRADRGGLAGPLGARRARSTPPTPPVRCPTGFDRVADRPKLYVLDMFPYPSGAGLHVGHPLGYIGTDVFARYQRMAGRNVLHTLGYDAFGLPAEQYAVQTGTHPRITTEANIAIIAPPAAAHRPGPRPAPGGGHHRRRRSTGGRSGSSCRSSAAGTTATPDRARPIAELEAELDAGTREPDPGHEPVRRARGPSSTTSRAARWSTPTASPTCDEVPVNWCPGLGTVLANEEVTADGRSERGNFPVFRRPMKQWMMRITAYADRLLADLDRLDWPESIKLMQRNWIGRSEGAEVRFSTEVGADHRLHHPARHALRRHLHGAGPRAPDGRRPAGRRLARRHRPAVDRRRRDAEGGRRGLPHRGRPARASSTARPTDREKTGVFLGATATNPVNGEPLPGVRRRLRADGLRHRRDHGRAGPGPARLGLRRGVRAADRPHRAAARGLGGRGLRRRGAGHQQRQRRGVLDGLADRRGQAHHHRPGWPTAAPATRPSPTSCTTGCSPGSATGASRSRSSSTSTTCRSPCPTTSCPVLLPEVDDYSPRTFDDRRHHVGAGAAARPGRRLGRGDARPGRRAEDLPPRAEHDAELGRVVLVRAALPRPHQRERLRRPRGRALLDGPAVRGRHRRRRPLRRRRRARRAAPALRALLAQGAVRPRPPELERAVPAAGQPGLHPGARLHRRPRLLRRGQRGRRARRPLLPRRRPR